MKLMAAKPLVVACLLSLCATPAVAQDKTTLQSMLAKGVIIHGDLLGKPRDLPVKYNTDGTFVMTLGAQELPGKWRVDGDKFCTSNLANPEESCFAIPAGKKPGDSFKVTTPAMGETTITINQ